MQTPPLKIAVVVASKGRPQEVVQLLHALAEQSLPPAQIIVSGVTEADTLGVDAFPDVVVVHGPAGLCAQRNRGIEAMRPDMDICAMLDDDYLPDPYALEGISNLFAQNPDVVGANGRLLADGINSAGISYDTARAMLKERQAGVVARPAILDEAHSLYGCNMVYRCSAIAELRFDEVLPLYGWQEDVDFSVRIAPRGRLVRSDAFQGVHRGIKSARLSGVRLGYSQIANPLYLVRKGTMPARFAAQIMIQNLLANAVRSLAPEPWVDRLGRARGNWLALWDALRNRADPRRVLEF
jgi:GT2 family glycosyltransferase